MHKKGRIKVRLFCIECESKNYSLIKPAGAQRGTLTLKKHCPTCNRHTEHREAK
jgi:large subunit ribosomal protein L33